ncbi:hypothetical protein FYK55_21665 [Roseiconus nitratireducens]|uniref:Uncharacterized protein n=1 Tax=Roseiconus nitratireducens TaxID=2605748 RepID=A0A5M6D0M4_9BACT|nr:hypothetical protein [Roseiconus nitratireducens]KAA5540240.1 hypothetical protein FYK55_21665 [Roseiconus nitratireducens]
MTLTSFIIACSIAKSSPSQEISAGQSITLPDVDLPQTPPQAVSPRTQELIRQAIEGKPVPATADPMLQDVLDHIRGSRLLEGFPDAEDVIPPPKQPGDRAKSLAEHDNPDSTHRYPRLIPEAAPWKNRVKELRTAELLLRTARLLAKQRPVDEKREQLVNEMCRQAVLLASPEPSHKQPSQTRPPRRRPHPDLPLDPHSTTPQGGEPLSPQSP